MAIVQSSEDAIIGKDLNGIITSWNPAAEKLFGYSENEAIGQSISILGVPNRLDEFKEIIETVRKGRKVERYETQRKRKDGTLVDVSVTASPAIDEERKLIRLSVIDRDIFSQKQASQYARSLIEASLDPLVTISPDGKITDVNEATVKVTGVSRQKLIGTDFSNYFTEPEQARDGYQLVFSRGTVTDYTLTIRHKDGKLIDVLYNASVYKDVAGNVLGVFAAARDITVQKQASQYAQSLAAIVRSSEDAVISEALDGTITSWNPAAEKMFGYTEREALGKPMSIIATSDRLEEYKEIIETVRNGRKVERYETKRKRKNGTVVDVAVTVSPVRDEEGKLIGLSAIDRDISSQKQASQYARSLIEASLDPLVTVSADGKIMDVNEATVKVTGVSREQLIGSDVANYFTEPEKARAGYELVFSKGTVTDYALTIRHRNGKLTDVLYNASVYTDVNGKVLGLFAAARDITAQRKAEAQVAEQRAKELERLAELERFQKLTVGRELKRIELKKEIEELKRRLGEPT